MAEETGTLEIQSPSQDAAGVSLVEGGELIEGEHNVLCEIGEVGV
jgi:hypothetical protein